MPDTLALLEALYAHAPVGLGYLDGDLRYRRVNARLAAINGRSVEDHLGRRPAELLGAVGEQAEARFREVMATGAPVTGVVISGETLAEPGRMRHWVGDYYPVVAPDGTAFGLGAAIVDVTELHEATERERAARHAAERAQARAEVLARASAALSSSMRTEGIIAELARSAVPALGDWCAIHLAQPDAAPRLIAVAHADPAREPLAWELNQRYPPQRDSPTGAAAVIRSGEREVFREIPGALLEAAAVDADHARILAELQLRSAVVLPLSARGSVLGALTLVMAESERLYDDELLSLAESLAAAAGLALDNARLYAEQVSVARALQRSLLPAGLPGVPGADLAARYRAAGRSNEVGGDFYDVFAADEGEWGFVIGDVVGKGAEAAAITALVRATLQASALRGDGPGAALRLVDEALRRRPGRIQFCSAIHGRMRPARGGGLDVRLFSAGHPVPLVVRSDGEVEAVDVRGTLLGVTAAPEFGDATLHLAEGDTMLLYTDGATELRGQDPWRGESALRAVLESAAGASPRELVERVERQALVQSGGELRDDLALLAIRAAPFGATVE
jgi:serine phosphatase RsbU (regulator of sigma subunit)